MNNETAIEWHLANNFYPPISEKLVPVAIQAIRFCRNGHEDNNVILPNGIVRTAGEIVEDLRLDF